MTSRDSIANLLKQGMIKKCPVDHKAVGNLVKRAHLDLKTARRNLSEDEECAYNYAYNSMLRLGLALMFSKGHRPEIKGKHYITVKFVNTILGDKFKKLVNDYDFMRKKRHKFIYEPDIPCSGKEAKDAIATAEEFFQEITGVIRSVMPQKEFDFDNKMYKKLDILAEKERGKEKRIKKRFINDIKNGETGEK